MPTTDLVLSVAERTRAILASRGLSLSEVSRASRSLFHDDVRFHIPPNLYYRLEQRGFVPGIHQLFVLSRVSQYRLVDWLAVFGLVLDEIPRLQAILPARYTTLIDENVYDEQTWFLAFEPITRGPSPGSLRPVGDWLRIGPPRHHFGLDPTPNAGFLYAKIGCYDALAFPELLPGSIVRITKEGPPVSGRGRSGPTGLFHLIEHAGGLACAKIHAIERNRIVLCPIELPFAHAEFELGKEARILGAVDFEFRPMTVPMSARVSPKLARYSKPQPLAEITSGLPLDVLLRRARRRSGLTFREASAKSALIARTLHNREFFCAPGSLSDYETTTHAPRHIHKVFSLCVLYSVSVWEFMTAAGLRLPEAGTGIMPDELLVRAGPAASESAAGVQPVTTGRSESALAEFPYFFGRAAADLLKMSHLSIRDIFWSEGPRESFHPYLADAIAVIIDRHKKRVTWYPSSPLWAQPSYILLGRDGNYVCTSCSSDGKMIVMRPFSNGFERPLRFRRSEEIEVVGRVVGILRRLPHHRKPFPSQSTR